MNPKKHIHHWLIDCHDQGKCKTCGATRDFKKLQNANDHWLKHIEKEKI
ncbi:unnamed protein product [marine sediment metagenome]|uniref:Uncharacterized protein n=1 Tax=marine sediment metagenome TaxID=412755 RepID=X1GIX3_9ZZZZ